MHIHLQVFLELDNIKFQMMLYNTMKYYGGIKWNEVVVYATT